MGWLVLWVKQLVYDFGSYILQSIMGSFLPSFIWCALHEYVNTVLIFLILIT